jgi:hypothetical protein
MKRIELPNLNLPENPNHIIERLLSTRKAMIQRTNQLIKGRTQMVSETIEMTDTEKSAKIAELNDKARQDPSIYSFTQAVRSLNREQLNELTKQIKEFNNFTERNDPHEERDFGKIEFNGESYLFKIDYYDNQLRYGSPFPEDEFLTRRVITVMEASEY